MILKNITALRREAKKSLTGIADVALGLPRWELSQTRRAVAIVEQAVWVAIPIICPLLLPVQNTIFELDHFGTEQ